MQYRDIDYVEKRKRAGFDAVCSTVILIM